MRLEVNEVVVLKTLGRLDLDVILTPHISNLKDESQPVWSQCQSWPQEANSHTGTIHRNPQIAKAVPPGTFFTSLSRQTQCAQ
jgi:hypothetical protein